MLEFYPMRCPCYVPHGHSICASGELLLPSATTDLADHQPGVDAEPHRQAHPIRRLQARIQRPHGLDHPEPAAHGPLDRVFMSLGIAKVHQQAIAEVLRNVAIKALDDLGTGVLVGAHNLAQVFWVELAGEACGIHQVTEQDGELAAFGVRRRRRGWYGEALVRGASAVPGGASASGWGAGDVGRRDASVPPVQTSTSPSSSTASR